MVSQEAVRQAEKCRFCFMCRHLCPVQLQTGRELNTPRAKGLLLSMVKKGTAEFDRATVSHMIASAISFMHNVIREVTGIIFIPLAAKKIGSLESTGLPGIAAMDVCLPIIERSCGENAVIYGFATGVIMCIVTSLGVPLIMGV